MIRALAYNGALAALMVALLVAMVAGIPFTLNLIGYLLSWL